MLAKPQQTEQFRAEKERYRSSRTVAVLFQPKSGVHPFGWKRRARQQFSAGKTRFSGCKRTEGRQFYLNRASTRSVGSPGPKTSVQRRQSVSSQQQNSSRAVSNQIWYAPVWLEAVAFESREVRGSNTSHLTRPTEIQNSLKLAKPAANRAVPCRKSEISQQQNGGGTLSTQNGHAPVRIEAQSQTVVQCRQNEILQMQKNSSRAVLTQIGHEPGRVEAQGHRAVQCRQNESLQPQNSSGAISTRIGHAPVRLEAQGQKQQFSAGKTRFRSSKRTVAGQV